jgi:glycosyltransferase involved in cell wall biosynthesis
VNVCFVGKFPPIQGGVSAFNLWTVCALVEAGHRVHVVTNSEEVEAEFRLHDLCADSMLPGPPAALCSDRFSLHSTGSAPVPSYIPWTNPFVTKLAAAIVEVVRQERCDFIFSFYLEPYVVAAALASSWTGVPFGIRTAGSDVTRLMSHPELRATYREAYRRASFVFASAPSFRGLIAEGVDPSRLVPPFRRSLPTDYFRPDALPLPMDTLLAAGRPQVPGLEAVYRALAQKPFDPSLPTIGIYGKVGPEKGSLDLVRALGRLRREGLRFNFLAMTQGRPKPMRQFVQALYEAELGPCTWLLPFLPHWQVPNFIKTCTAVCFLERDFPILVHTPSVPREVFAVATCLVLSRQIAERGPHATRLVHGDNVLLADPRQAGELEAGLRQVIEAPARAAAIGRRGYESLARGGEDWPAFREAAGAAFAEIGRSIRKEALSVSVAEMQACLGRLYTDGASRRLFEIDTDFVLAAYDLTADERQALEQIDRQMLGVFARGLLAKRRDRLERWFPLLFRVVPAEVMSRLWARYNDLHPQRVDESTGPQVATFACFMTETLPGSPAAPAHAADVARYEGVMFRATHTPTSLDALARINEPPPRGPAVEAASPTSCFHLEEGVYVEDFGCDILDVVKRLRQGEILGAVAVEPTALVFQTVRGAMAPKIVRINGPTREVLAAADGRTTAAQVARRLLGGAAADEATLGQTLGVVDTLAQRRVLRLVPKAVPS